MNAVAHKDGFSGHGVLNIDDSTNKEILTVNPLVLALRVTGVRSTCNIDAIAITHCNSLSDRVSPLCKRDNRYVFDSKVFCFTRAPGESRTLLTGFVDLFLNPSAEALCL